MSLYISSVPKRQEGGDIVQLFTTREWASTSLPDDPWSVHGTQDASLLLHMTAEKKTLSDNRKMYDKTDVSIRCTINHSVLTW